MNKNPQLRPSATEILQDPFIKSHLQVCVCVCVCMYVSGVCMCVRACACVHASIYRYFVAGP